MLKNLKSLFITTDEGQQTAKEQQPNATDPIIQSPQPHAASTSKQVDNAILDKLLKALEDNNQQGFDYLEYRRALKSLAALSMEEKTKFQSAFATASTMDVTLDKLLASIEFYKKVLKNEEDIFVKASNEQYAVNVEEKIREKEKMNDMIKEKSLMIQKLTEEIRSLQAKQEEITTSIESANSKIKETNSSFNQALYFLFSQMDMDASKLKEFIK